MKDNVKKLLLRASYRQLRKNSYYKSVGFTLIIMEINDDKLVCTQYFYGKSEEYLLTWNSESEQIKNIKCITDISYMEVNTLRDMTLGTNVLSTENLIPINTFDEFLI